MYRRVDRIDVRLETYFLARNTEIDRCLNKQSSVNPHHRRDRVANIPYLRRARQTGLFLLSHIPIASVIRQRLVVLGNLRCFIVAFSNFSWSRPFKILYLRIHSTGSCMSAGGGRISKSSRGSEICAGRNVTVCLIIRVFRSFIV